jgi:hypothetical protein
MKVVIISRVGRPKGSPNKIKAAPKYVTPMEKKSLAAPSKDLTEDKVYYCTSCGKGYVKLKGNFRASQSPFFKGWGAIPICATCLDYYEKQYTERLGSNDEAIKRLALHFNIYFNDSLLTSSKNIRADQSRIGAYISNANLRQYKDKTYDTYLEEVTEEERKNNKIETVDELKEIQNKNKDAVYDTITSEILMFWGAGYALDDYVFLDNKYNQWVSRHECKTKAQESIFQKICLIELQINKATQNGDKVDSLIKSFNDLIGSANIKPVQTKDNVLADQNTFGMLIQKWENERPIPEPDLEWQDVDGISKYISVWFFGHLCRMLNINNKYSQLYDEEIAKYTVQKPQYEEDAELAFDDIFSKAEDREIKNDLTLEAVAYDK